LDALTRLNRYLELIVEPTIDDAQRNALSVRHGYLACVVTFHTIDRVQKSTGNLRKEWNKQSIDFAVVDLVCHTLKHVEVPGESDSKRIPLKAAMPGAMGFNTHALNEFGPDVRHIYLSARAAVLFIRKWVRENSPVDQAT